MLLKKINLIFILVLLYQTPLYSKSTSSNDINSKNLSKYFSGIVAFENRNNSKALNFFKSSKILINQHEPYLERFVMSLILENKVAQAINIIKTSNKKGDFDFYEASLHLNQQAFPLNVANDQRPNIVLFHNKMQSQNNNPYHL